MERRARANVFLNEVHLAGGDIDEDFVGKFECQVFLELFVLLEHFEPAIDRNAVREMDNVIAGREFDEVVDGLAWYFRRGAARRPAER